MKRSGERKVVLIISLSPFIASLAMPALEFRQHPPVRRLTTLLWGWWGVLTGDFPWFANATYFAGLLFASLKQRAVAIASCVIALGLGSQAQGRSAVRWKNRQQAQYGRF